MEKNISDNRFFNLDKCLVWFLLIAFITMSPVYVYSGSEGDNMDVIENFKWHFETQLSDQETNEQMRQLELNLKNGMPPSECCTHCHAEKWDNP